jgi:metallopeptidase family M12-like protein/type IX secretion system substrate protein
MRLVKLLLLLMIPSLMFAQGPIFEKVQQTKATSTTSNYDLVKVAPSTFMTASIQAEVSDGVILELNAAAISKLKEEQPELLQLNIPLPDQSEVTVALVKNRVLTEDFNLYLSSDPNTYAKYARGEYYHGTINNAPSTLVAISVFDNEIHGVIMTDAGNYVLGKLANSDKHIIYNDNDLSNSFELGCEMEDDGIGYHPSQLEYTGERSPGDCIRVYIEIDDDIVTQKGGGTTATNYITGLFNEVITLYANDGITMVISEILAWTTPAPYSGSSSSAMLNSFQANTGAFNGDLAHLVSYQASGGIAAGFAGICASNVDNSKCFSSIDASYANVPTYSWSVMVCTHEMGHLIGSRHTHACVWNGNNTAIDGCAGQTEGSCSLPGYPPGGGTIMSYCHLQNVGINLNLGFGPQPQAVVLNTVNNASCLSSCGGGPTCYDGVQNGEETGVDCGGPSCPACPEPCNDNVVTVTINLDNYPGETTWDIRNSGGSVVASGGPYSGAGSTVVSEECLVDGCYDFTIYDSYGDGICCGYGNGSYEVTNGATVLASGGAFGSSETTNFCLGGGGPIPGCTDPSAHNYDPSATVDDGSCETCSDGVQNGDESGVDCGGSLCPSCPTGGQILGSYFETGWDGWSDGGSDCARYAGSRSWEGNYSIRIRDNSGTSSAMTSPTLNLSSYSSIDVQFYFYAYSMENGEDFWLRYYDGSSWTTVAAWASGTSFNNNTFYTATVTLTSSSYNFPSNAQIRFQCDASANSDHIYIDEVTVTAYAALPESGETIVTTDEVFKTSFNLDPESNIASLDQPDLSVYPNPAKDVLNITTDKVIESVQIVSVSGQLMRTIQSDDAYEEVNISNLQAGMYYVLIRTEGGELITEKFIKM